MKPPRTRLPDLLEPYEDELPTRANRPSTRIARLLRLWGRATERCKRLLEEVASEMAPPDCPERALDVPVRPEMRAARFARLFQSCTPARQRLIEQLAWEWAPDNPGERMGPLAR